MVLPKSQGGESYTIADDMKLTICMFCKEWVHPGCYDKHVGKHVPSAICKGFRREKERLDGVETYVECFSSPDVPVPTPATDNFQMFYNHRGEKRKRRCVDSSPCSPGRKLHG